MSSLSLRSFAYPDPSLLVFDFVQAELCVLLKSLAQLDLLLLVPGVACIGFSPLASDLSQFGLSSSLHSFARLDFSPLTSGFAAVGSLPPSQSHICLELSLFFAGIACTEPVFSLSVIEAAKLGPVMPLRSFAQLGLTSFIPDCTNFGFTLLLLGHNTDPSSSTNQRYPKIVSLCLEQGGFTPDSRKCWTPTGVKRLRRLIPQHHSATTLSGDLFRRSFIVCGILWS